MPNEIAFSYDWFELGLHRSSHGITFFDRGLLQSSRYAINRSNGLVVLWLKCRVGCFKLFLQFLDDDDVVEVFGGELCLSLLLAGDLLLFEFLDFEL